ATPSASKSKGAGTKCAMSKVMETETAAATLRHKVNDQTPLARRRANDRWGPFHRCSHHAISRPIQLTGCPMAANAHCGYPRVASSAKATRVVIGCMVADPRRDDEARC